MPGNSRISVNREVVVTQNIQAEKESRRQVTATKGSKMSIGNISKHAQHLQATSIEGIIPSAHLYR